jgi:hypothetical protein
MNDPIKLIESVGFPIALIIILLWGFFHLHKNHNEERKEWREDSKLMHENTNKIFSESTDAIKELTIAIRLGNKK